MLNWRRIAITGFVAGMIAVTGCSTNLPETNQGNRNGQRVADAVNRREDTYRTTSNRLAETENTGILGRTTRGIRNATHNITNPTRSTGVRGNSLNLGRPEGRVGNTFRYGNNTGTTRGLNNGLRNRAYPIDNCAGSICRPDMGATTSDQALVNSRVTRSTTIAPAAATETNNELNRVSIPDKPETKRIDTKRQAPKANHTTKPKKAETTPNVTRSAPAPAPAVMPAAPATTPQAVPKPAPKSVSRAASRTTANKSTVNRVTAKRTNNAIANKTVTNNTVANRGRHVANNAATHNQNATRYGMTPHRVTQNHTNNTNRPNRAARRGYENKNHTNKIVRNSRPISRNFAMEQTVAVVNTDDSTAINDINEMNDDLAFFRKKTEETPVTPDVPAPNTVPENQPQSYDDTYDNGYFTTVNPEPAAQPAPTTPARTLPTRTASTRVMK